MARTLFIDPVPQIQNTYSVLLDLRRRCLDVMRAGFQLRCVAEAARSFISEKHPNLLGCLPKSLGFGLGLDFREAALILNSKNPNLFAPNMVFSLSVGFHNIPLAPAEKAAARGSVRKLSKYSILIADTVMIQGGSETPEVLTKHSVDWCDVSYFINDSSDGQRIVLESDGASVQSVAHGTARSSRLRDRKRGFQEETTCGNRKARQAELMQQKIVSKREEAQHIHNGHQRASSMLSKVPEIEAYISTREYPNDIPSNEIYVDVEAQSIFVPVNGVPIPFHISMIKNTVQPDPDRNSTYLRLNFFAPGQPLGKDVVPTTTSVIEEHGHSSIFVKEMLYRSHESRRLTAAYRMIQELRKRFRQHAAKAAEEADLVAQEKLVKMRDQRIPRMSDLTMRPFISGKKTTGTLEAHTNGLRFISKKHETVDLMYENIKHSLFQPCENEVMVLIHFHLKHPVIIGRKKTHDVQFFTEVVDASVALESGKSAMYDPDEIDEEQRERHLRKKLNDIFKEFCKKVERVSKHYQHKLEFDIPYRDLGFHGVPHREMVLIQPTVHCLVNLTETPFFIVELDHVSS
mmetsp:Transcript_2922/g.8893  ORF Transcript_2922/g.8893 Transcript_2922/m.8893 type:complete len:574 (-) Transcript_2922:748-2469(-)